MTVTWLGHAGLLFEGRGLKILIDPYFSDSVGRRDPQKRRRVPVRGDVFDIKPDVMIFTHDHLDHYDPETAARFIREGAGMTVLAPSSVWNRLEKPCGNNFVMFNPHTTWTEGSIKFTAVSAEHSDPCAIGAIIDDGERKYYITGDTLYNERIFPELPRDIYAVFLPVNGVGNNMNMADAAEFCRRVNPRIAVPVHCGMFDSIDMHAFEFSPKAVPEIYEKIEV